jgi:hypothetical protein
VIPTGTGILETILDRLGKLEEAIADLTTEIRNPEPTDLNGIPLNDAERIWSAGAMDLAEATRFSGLRRNALYDLMRSGELPYSCPSHKRLVPRLWFVRYLARNRQEEENTAAKRGNPKTVEISSTVGADGDHGTDARADSP